MKTPTSLRIRQIITPAAISAVLLAANSAFATTSTWSGTGTLWDAQANYLSTPTFSTTNDLNFGAINSSTSVVLSATTVGTINVQSLYFGTTSNTGTGTESITFKGDGTAGDTIVNLSKNIYLPSTTSSVVTLGSDLTINLTNEKHTVSYQANSSITSTPAVLPVLVIASKLTGGGASTNFTGGYSQLGSTSSVSAAPAIVLSNNSNTVDTTYTIAGLFSYTSINNTGAGAGASALGISNASSGAISLGNGGRFSYIGSGDQTTNRAITYGGANAINNYATSSSNLTFNGTFTTAATAANTFSFGVSNGNTITMASGFGNGTGAGIYSLTKSAGTAYYDANGVYRSGDGNGTLVLTGAFTYTGTTTVASGTLQVGNGTSGNLINSGGTYSALNFTTSGGTFNVNEASGVSQNMGSLTFTAGDGNVQSTNNGGNSTLTFTSLAGSSKGATGNFVTTNGVNGSTNKIVLTGQATGVLGARYFYEGNSSSASFAYYDSTGYVRGINYGTDSNTQNNTTGAAFTSGNSVQVGTTNVTGQSSVSIGTLQIADTSTVSLATGATLTVGGILKSGGNASTISSGTITTGNSNELVIRVDQASDTLTIASSLASTSGAGLTKSGLGTLKLTGTNSLTGSVYINSGVLQFQKSNLPNAGGGYWYLGNAKLESLSGNTSTYATLSLVGSGTLQVDADTLTFANSTNLNSSGVNTLTVGGAGNVVFSGAVTGAGSGLTKFGSGTVTLSNAANTYSGPTTVNEGQLTLNGALAVDTGVTVNSGATLAGSGTANGTVTGTNATINGNGLTLGSTTLNGTSTLSGYNIASSVTVNSGTTVLTGTTKSTSALTVSAGATLDANGMIIGSASVSGLLKGNSTVTGNLTLTSGTLSPGNSPGITTVQGDFTMNHTSTLVAQVSGAVAGDSYDQVKVSGNVSLDGALDLSALSGLTLGDKITLIDNTGTGTTTGYFSTIITNGSTYTLSSNSDFTFTAGATEYLLSFSSNADGDSSYNDVTLTVVPEPGTWVMLVGGIGMLAFGQRLRRRGDQTNF
ncbi:MAG: beta strand repeat-containing protein [Chthoniobacteraceae bacterium]